MRLYEIWHSSGMIGFWVVAQRQAMPCAPDFGIVIILIRCYNFCIFTSVFFQNNVVSTVGHPSQKKTCCRNVGFYHQIQRSYATIHAVYFLFTATYSQELYFSLNRIQAQSNNTCATVKHHSPGPELNRTFCGLWNFFWFGNLFSLQNKRIHTNKTKNSGFSCNRNIFGPPVNTVWHSMFCSTDAKLTCGHWPAAN